MATLKVALDAGHCLHTAGKRCMKSLDPNETREWVLNSTIAEKAQKTLKDYQCQVLRVDDVTGKKDTTLNERIKKANEWGADVYVSIHHNAGVNGGSGGGTVVFRSVKSSKKSAELQAAIYRNAIKQTGLVGNRADPTPERDYKVLRETNAPAVLIEGGFMDSQTDVPVILTDDFSDGIATAIVTSLIEVFGLERRRGTVTQMEFDALMENWLARQAEKPESPWAKMAEAVKLGISDGTRPQSFATREEVATMILNARKK